MPTSVIYLLSSDKTDGSINPHVDCVEAMPGPANSRPEAFLINFKFGPWTQATQTFLTNRFLVQILVALIIHNNCHHIRYILHKIETNLYLF
jgi:hypothetical protein